MDTRYAQLANLLLEYSVSAKHGDKIWIRCIGLPSLQLAREVYTRALEIGAHPYLDISDDSLTASYFSLAQEHHLTAPPAIEEFVVNWCDKIISLYGEENSRSLANVDPKKFITLSQQKKKIREIIMTKPWVLTYVPTHALAQDAGMGTKEFEEFYFNSTLRDWKKEGMRYTKLAKKLSNAQTIHLVGKDTDLTLSAKGRTFVPDNGECNMPGGEIFTAPVDTSVNGRVYFEFPLLRSGKLIRDIRFWFEDGRIVKATASENEDLLLQMLDTDEGARTLGEFAIGMNPGIKTYMYNTLFDEKIEGTIHMAFGEAYAECGGVNKSAMHVDIVKEMRYPGTSLTVDGQIVMKDGKLIE